MKIIKIKMRAIKGEFIEIRTLLIILHATQRTVVLLYIPLYSCLFKTFFVDYASKFAQMVHL